MVVDGEIDGPESKGSQLIKAILASSPSDFAYLKTLIEAGAPLWFQEEEGLSALHAACLVENTPIVKLLIEKGAPWNVVNDLGYTAGDVALSLNDEESYRIIRDEGMRSEYLLQLLASKSVLPSQVLCESDTGPLGSSEEFLKSTLSFSEDSQGREICSVVSGNTTVGVMMGWERGIMEATVANLCATHPGLQSGLRILNVGFGLGIIDTLFQSLRPSPAQHTIIEAHKDVLSHMRNKSWYNKSNVKILEGRWQDFVHSGDIFGETGWDIIYIDTFAEGYEELKAFFDIVPDLLNGPNARFSFFNGLGATNALFYDVYTQIVEMHLKDCGIDVGWSDVDAQESAPEERWWGTKEYFKVRMYRLPIGKMIGH